MTAHKLLIEALRSQVETGDESLCVVSRQAVDEAIEVLLAAESAAAVPDGWEKSLDEALSERDKYHEAADDLAAQIAAITGEEIGEHSNINEPWRNAMLAADEYIAKQIRSLCARAPAREPLTRQQIQKIVIDVCDKIYPQDNASYSEADTVFYGAFVHAIEAAHNIKAA